MKRSIVVFMLVAIALANSAVARQKIWETDKKINKMVGPVRLQMEREQRRGAKPKQFWLRASSNSPYAIGSFQGVCHESVTVELTTTLNSFDTEAFKGSRSSDDLPIAAVVNVMKDTLIKQCEQLQVIRVRFKPQQYPFDDYDYLGSLTKGENWRLQDGYVKNSYDKAHQFILDHIDPLTVGGVYHEASCYDNEPVILLEPRKRQHAFSKRMKLFHFAELAKHVSKHYGEECPQVNRIKYILYPMPSSHRCANGDECFLIGSRNIESNGWQIDQSQFALLSSKGPIADALDMMEVLAAGEFKIVYDYSGYFEFFYDAFINSYSINCRSYLKDPVGREYRTIYQRFDKFGSLISSEQMGPAITIFMERKYAARFDKYHKSWPSWATKQFMIKFANMANPTPNKAVGMELALGFLTKTTQQLADAISGQCMDERIQAIYLNMYNFAHNQPAIKGLYTTDKKPAILPPGANSSSAPKMLKAIMENRKQRLAEYDKQKAQNELKRKQSKSQASSIELEIPEQTEQPQIVEKTIPEKSNTQEKAAQEQRRGSSAKLYKNQREINKKIQTLRRQYNADIKAASQAYRQKLRNTTDKEERRALKETHRINLEAMKAEFQRKIAQLKSKQHTE